RLPGQPLLVLVDLVSYLAIRHLLDGRVIDRGIVERAREGESGGNLALDGDRCGGPLARLELGPRPVTDRVAPTHAIRDTIGLALEPIRGVAQASAPPSGSPVHRPGSLLNDMRQLVGQYAPPTVSAGCILARTEDDVPPHGVGQRVHRACRLGRARFAMNP